MLEYFGAERAIHALIVEGEAQGAADHVDVLVGIVIEANVPLRRDTIRQRPVATANVEYETAESFAIATHALLLQSLDDEVLEREQQVGSAAVSGRPA